MRQTRPQSSPEYAVVSVSEGPHGVCHKLVDFCLLVYLGYKSWLHNIAVPDVPTRVRRRKRG